MTPFDVDGRYHENNIKLFNIFSEENYYRECMLLESKYLLSVLREKTNLSLKETNFIKECVESLCDNKNLVYLIKKSELQTRHDIISVCDTMKYVLVEIHKNGFSMDTSKFVHFGLTSQDVVSTVNAKQILDANKYMCLVVDKMLNNFGGVFNISNIDLMPSFTHGRYAVPVSPKHIYNVYSSRILEQIKVLPKIADINDMRFATGAVGNNISTSMLGMDIIIDDIRYQTLNDYFINTCDSTCDGKKYFFQNDNYPTAMKSMKSLLSLSNILLDMAQDMWMYCSKDYMMRNRLGNESGSSAMPQKINPIMFENAMGNFKLAIGMSETYISELEKSILQRDLSDITMVRNMGLVYSYINQAILSMSNGFKEYSLNQEIIRNDIQNNVQMFSEYIQLYLKLYTSIDGYKLMKDISSKRQSWTYSDLLLYEEFSIIPDACKEMIGEMIGDTMEGIISL